MAVWYELRYPDYEINRLMPGSGQEGIKVSDVMYRIIERGGNRMGPRRGFLFAKEFGRNIDIQ